MWILILMILPFAALAYVGWHMWCLLPWGWVLKLLLVGCMTGSLLLLPASIMRYTDRLPMPLAIGVYEVGTSSVIVLLYIFILFLLLDLGRLVHLVPRTMLYNNGWTAGAIMFVMLGLFLYGNLNYRHKYRQELQLTTDKTIGKPLKLVLLSDLHIGYANRRKELGIWVDMINAEQPDLVLIAGDIIDGSIRPLVDQQMHSEFLRLKAPVYACMGNHEYYSGWAAWRDVFRGYGVRVLENARLLVRRGDQTLAILGENDPVSHDSDIQIAAGMVPHWAFRILLAHRPTRLAEHAAYGVRLQLSGHTHGGAALGLDRFVARANEGHVRGIYREHGLTLYVNSGTGQWAGFPTRLGVPPEITLTTLRKACG